MSRILNVAGWYLVTLDQLRPRLVAITRARGSSAASGRAHGIVCRPCVLDLRPETMRAVSPGPGDSWPKPRAKASFAQWRGGRSAETAINIRAGAWLVTLRQRHVGVSNRV